MPLQDQSNYLPRSQIFVILSGLSLSLLVCFIDINSAGILLPTIGKDLNAADTSSWAATSALISNSVFLVLYGRLSDIFGRKNIFLIGTGLLSLGNLLSGFAGSGSVLYFFRAIAGVGSGGVSSLTMIIMSDIVPLQERGKYQGLLSANIGLGSIVGPFMAAGFVQNVTWRAHFWTLSALAAVCIPVVIILVPASKMSEGIKEKLSMIDYWGSFFSTAATILLLIPISGGGTYFQWSNPMIITMLAAGGASAIAFLYWEWGYAALPMMPRKHCL